MGYALSLLLSVGEDESDWMNATVALFRRFPELASWVGRTPFPERSPVLNLMQMRSGQSDLTQRYQNALRRCLQRHTNGKCGNPVSIVWISTKLGLRMGPGPKQTPLAFGADLDKETDPEFWTFTFISKGDKCTILIITIRCIKVAEWARAKYWTIWF